MRLTLRTLLAHEHGLLEEEQATLIAQKIEQSPFVLQLLRHLKDRAARAEIVPLSIEARGTASLEKVVHYLDYALPAEEVVKLENECFASDRLLAEVTSCHEILAEWLSTPTPLEPELRESLYALMPAQPKSIEPEMDEIAIDLPSLAYQSVPPAEPTVERKPQSDSLPKRRSILGTALQLVALSACVMGLVAFVVSNRDHVEQMIAQHWQQKATQSIDQEPWPAEAAPQGQPTESPSQRFVAQAVPLGHVAKPPISSVETDVDAEVAATSFERPISSSATPVSLPSGVFRVVRSTEVLCQKVSLQTWSILRQGELSEGRMIVSPQGSCKLQGDGSEFVVGSMSEIGLTSEHALGLRYGTIELTLSPGTTFRMHAAAQEIALTAGQMPVQIKLKTAPVAQTGVDFASDAMNQEIQIEGAQGRCEVTLSSCRGPFTIEPGQKIAAHMNFGVRSDASISFEPVDSPTAMRILDAIPPGMEVVTYLQQQLSSSSAEFQGATALMLAQLGEMGSLPEAWSQWEGRKEFREHARQFRSIVAQDAELASRLKATFDVQNPQYGSLVYRLVCGFSRDQLSEATSAQLEGLLRHPDPTVRVWTEHQLSDPAPAADVRLSRMERPPS